MSARYELCTECTTALANDDWTHLDYYEDSDVDASVAAFLESAPALVETKVSNGGYFDCACCGCTEVDGHIHVPADSIKPLRFNRSDIATAAYYYSVHYAGGQFCSVYEIQGRLKNIGFKVGVTSSFDEMNENARAWYDNMVNG